MEVIHSKLQDVVLLSPKVFSDSRGFFFESFNKQAFEAATGQAIEFVQDNHSRSTRGVLRGLHYQVQQAQGKLVRVVVGCIFDVAVDIRQSSPTFGQWVGYKLSAESKQQVWVPAGFAHGFLVLSDVAEVLYKTTDYYAPQHERCILWNDLDLGIEWPIGDIELILSSKDQLGKRFKEAEVFL
ncbi:MAG TPA: dTDP-4-dehydrorhamnose 3,5-epimerase [Leptolyngbyaceae cyanobacterium]